MVHQPWLKNKKSKVRKKCEVRLPLHGFKDMIFTLRGPITTSNVTKIQTLLNDVSSTCWAITQLIARKYWMINSEFWIHFGKAMNVQSSQHLNAVKYPENSKKFKKIGTGFYRHTPCDVTPFKEYQTTPFPISKFTHSTCKNDTQKSTSIIL